MPQPLPSKKETLKGLANDVKSNGKEDMRLDIAGLELRSDPGPDIISKWNSPNGFLSLPVWGKRHEH